MKDYNALVEFCNTERQANIMQKTAELGPAGAAEALDITPSTIRRLTRKLSAVAASKGMVPDLGLVQNLPGGVRMERATTQVAMPLEDGTIQRVWIKTKFDKFEGVREEIIEGLKDQIPKARSVKRTSVDIDEDLCTLYTITDYHMGMFAWKDEGGDEWDTDIAEETLVQWFQEAIKVAPDSHTAILGQLGDFLHYDSMKPITPAHGHILDTDTRFGRLVRVAIRALRRVIAMMLKKHQHVHIVMAEGNHDESSSIWLREIFDVFYEDEDRVTVDTSVVPYYGFQFGNVSLLFHHGHKKTPKNIETAIAAQFRELIGKTKFTYCHMGHWHHKHVIEQNLMVVEQHQTLASKDAYAARGGYHSERGAEIITYDKDYGEVSRSRITPQMIKDLIKDKR